MWSWLNAKHSAVVTFCFIISYCIILNFFKIYQESELVFHRPSEQQRDITFDYSAPLPRLGLSLHPSLETQAAISNTPVPNNAKISNGNQNYQSLKTHPQFAKKNPTTSIPLQVQRRKKGQESDGPIDGFLYNSSAFTVILPSLFPKDLSLQQVSTERRDKLLHKEENKEIKPNSYPSSSLAA